MNRKMLLRCCFAFVLVASLVGCGSPLAASAAESGEKVVVHYWYSIGSALEAVVQQQIKDFNMSQDKIEVIGTFQGYYNDASAKIQQSLVAGTQPEIVMLERGTVPQYHAVGALEDLTPYIERDNFNLSDFHPGLMAFSVFDGEVVSLPLNRSTPILFYNKDAFAAAGLDPDRPPQTWDELIEYCKKLTVVEGSEVKQYGIEFPIDLFVFQSLVPQAGGSMLNADLTNIGFANESGLAALEFLVTLRDQNLMKVPPSNDAYTVTKQDFYNGTVAMMVESTAALKDTLDHTAGKFELGTAFMPKKDRYAVQTGGGNISILAQSDQVKKDAAWEFIKFMYSQESGGKFVADTGYIPVTTTIMNSPAVQSVWQEYPQYKVAYDQLSYVVEPATHADWAQISSVIERNIQAVIYDNRLTPQQALDAISAEVARILR